MAFSDPFVQTALECIRTQQITSANQVQPTGITQTNPLKGFAPTAIRQWIYFATMFGIDGAAKSYYNTDELSTPQKVVNAALTSATYVPATGWADTIRARMQAKGSTINTIRQGLNVLWIEAQQDPMKFIKITNASGKVRFAFNCFSALGGMTAIDIANKFSKEDFSKHKISAIQDTTKEEEETIIYKWLKK